MRPEGVWGLMETHSDLGCILAYDEAADDAVFWPDTALKHIVDCTMGPAAVDRAALVRLRSETLVRVLAFVNSYKISCFHVAAASEIPKIEKAIKIFKLHVGDPCRYVRPQGVDVGSMTTRFSSRPISKARGTKATDTKLP